MRVAKWGNSLAVRVPTAVAEELGLKEGDQVEIVAVGRDRIGLRRDATHEEALARIREMCVPVPPGFRFDREEANARGPE